MTIVQKDFNSEQSLGQTKRYLLTHFNPWHKLLYFRQVTNTSEDELSKNFVHGTVPSGVYTKSKTTIYFCCREDGKADVPIKLPRERPFYLFQFGDECQKVEGLTETEQFFHFEEEVLMWGISLDLIFVEPNQLKFQDPHPKVEIALFDKGLTLYYCYYDVTNKLKGFKVLVDSTPATYGFGTHYDDENGNYQRSLSRV